MKLAYQKNEFCWYCRLALGNGKKKKKSAQLQALLVKILKLKLGAWFNLNWKYGSFFFLKCTMQHATNKDLYKIIKVLGGGSLLSDTFLWWKNEV